MSKLRQDYIDIEYSKIIHQTDRRIQNEILHGVGTPEFHSHLGEILKEFRERVANIHLLEAHFDSIK